MVKLQDRVRWLRKQRGYTLRDVEQRSGISISFLSEIERGAIPSLTVMERLARAYGLTLGESLVGVEIEAESEPPQQMAQ